MPRGDGTGPIGAGPMTGRRVPNRNGYTSSEIAKQGFGAGRGMGGFNCRGNRKKFCMTQISNELAMDEKTILENQENILEKQIQQIKERLKNLNG